MTGEQVGGGLTPVVRVGETIRRATGPWTPAVHALLEHLAAVGFEGAPRVHGYDDYGREVIEFVEGEIRSDCDDEELAAIARLVRRLHDSTTTFQPPSAARWQVLVGSPDGGDVICHNDLSPANTVWSGGVPRAFIDWDLAAPGPRSWDVAYALYRFVPLYSDDDCARLEIPASTAGPADPCVLRRVWDRRHRWPPRPCRATRSRALRQRPDLGRSWSPWLVRRLEGYAGRAVAAVAALCRATPPRMGSLAGE